MTATLTLLFMLLPLPILAYVDPGTGSMLLQALIGGLLGLLFALKMYWRKVRAAVGRAIGGGAKDGE